MVDITVEPGTPYQIGTSLISKISVARINFLQYAECFQDRLKASARGLDESAAEKEFMRSRRIKQCTAFDRSGNPVKMDQVAFAMMPRKLFVKIHNALDDFGTERGSVIGEGDGINSPIIYKLGTPFEFTDTKSEQKPIGTEQKIIELEFIAKIGGDIEDVLCHSNGLDQTVALLKTCATPLGGETGLMRLPSWMLESLTVADGFSIMSSVLPVFTE